MKRFAIGTNRKRFEVLHATRGAQGAMMTLRPGEATDDEPHNEHPRSEQWLLVLDGTGVAVMGSKKSGFETIRLRKDSLLLIEKGELHQIKNTGRKLLRTLNFYIPPAYNTDGEPK